jgi:hypothetical protein
LTAGERERSVLRDATCQFSGRLERLVRGVQFADQPVLVRIGSREWLADEQYPARGVAGDALREPDQAAFTRDQTARNLEEAERASSAATISPCGGDVTSISQRPSAVSKGLISGFAGCPFTTWRGRPPSGMYQTPSVRFWPWALDVYQNAPCLSKVRFTGKWGPDATTVGAYGGTVAAVEVALCGAALGCVQDARQP